MEGGPTGGGMPIGLSFDEGTNGGYATPYFSVLPDSCELGAGDEVVAGVKIWAEGLEFAAPESTFSLPSSSPSFDDNSSDDSVFTVAFFSGTLFTVSFCRISGAPSRSA